MLLETYLKNNNSNIRKMHILSGIPETTVRRINKMEFSKWNIAYFDAIAKTVGKERDTVIQELENLKKKENIFNISGKYNLENRRYIGNKNKLLSWISELIDKNTKGNSFFDVFAGTGVVTKEMLDKYDTFILNDFLYSNNIIYKAFFGSSSYNFKKLISLEKQFNELKANSLADNYFSQNFGDKFFSVNDAKMIGEIRTLIEKNKFLNTRERAVLIASLIYSSDKIANTVGHYDAYRKKVNLEDKFKFNLINPIDTLNKEIKIFREDSNQLVRKVRADIAFIDPPYNSRQYSRFYHILENIAKCDKPKLTGVAMKPPVENMSNYCRSFAPEVFDDLIQNLDVNYIVVTYNNTYNSKSSSSKNKITHLQILESLNKVGKTKVFEMPFQFFNAGKTDLKEHKEFIFITEVKKKINIHKTNITQDNAGLKSIRSPLFYVGDKYKLMPQLNELFPKNINTYYDVFCGGGSASINSKAKKYVLNDIEKKIIDLHNLLQEKSKDIDLFINEMYKEIKKYGLSLSELEKNPKIENLKKTFKKTYYAKFNKDSYLKLREDYNKDQSNTYLLYLLIIYGFNHMIRFNSLGHFNLPVGNVDWNKNVSIALKNYSMWINQNKVLLSTGMDFEKFINSIDVEKDDFIYFDPPYLITFSDYNKLWGEKEEHRLYKLLDILNERGIRWGLSNMYSHKGRVNKILIEWSKKYNVYEIKSNYISRFDNTIKKDSKEIYITNYDTRKHI